MTTMPRTMTAAQRAALDKELYALRHPTVEQMERRWRRGYLATTVAHIECVLVPPDDSPECEAGEYCEYESLVYLPGFEGDYDDDILDAIEACGVGMPDEYFDAGWEARDIYVRGVYMQI